ncbi:MAG: hypothetical protein H6642_13750 [Caldilineaceae bacterium]|nr:hypothetical protein [Caldilineaceae bacterium]
MKNQTVSQLTDDATDEQLLNLCGVDPEAAEGAARLLVEAKNPLILYGPMAAQGATGEQVRNGLTNLAMVLDCYENLGYLGLNANKPRLSRCGRPARRPARSRAAG